MQKQPPLEKVVMDTNVDLLNTTVLTLVNQGWQVLGKTTTQQVGKEILFVQKLIK